MLLKKLEEFPIIYIQCHDSPDADAIGAAFGLYTYFQSKGKEVHLIYGGAGAVTRPALQILINKLEIPIEYHKKLPEMDLLITVDSQYKGGNITKFKAKNVAMIDHHPCCVQINDKCCIRSDYGSCCTVVWSLLQEIGYDVNKDVRLATALYYGLYCDTGRLSEIYHPKDREMRDSLEFDRSLIDLLIGSNLSIEELGIAGEALSHHYFEEEKRFAVAGTKPCDPNLLGIISDLIIQVATIDYCVVYSETPIGYKLSIRTIRQRCEANQLAREITHGIGSGGGHATKAGGFIMKRMFERTHGDEDFEKFLREKLAMVR